MGRVREAMGDYRVKRVLPPTTLHRSIPVPAMGVVSCRDYLDWASVGSVQVFLTRGESLRSHTPKHTTMGLISQAGKQEATDSGTGSSNAAELTIGGIRTLVGVYWEATGSATLTIEVFLDGGWETFDTVSVSSGSDVEVYEVPYDRVRAYLDSSRTKVVVTSKGVS